jgi:flagellar hook-associated protein 3 FlgL
MRVSDSMHYDSITYSTSKLEERLLSASTEASSGLKLNAPSDDPEGAATLVRLGTQEDRTTDYRNTIDRTQGDATASENTLASVTTLFEQAKDLALQGSSGALSPSDRQILAKQVDGLSADLVSLANTKGEHGYLFAGTATQTPPFTAAGTFQANDGTRNVEIASGVSVVANTSGARTVTAAGGTDVFQALTDLNNALTANDPTAVAASVTNLDAAHSQIVAAEANTGLLLSRLQSTDTVHQQTLTQITSAK